MLRGLLRMPNQRNSAGIVAPEAAVLAAARVYDAVARGDAAAARRAMTHLIDLAFQEMMLARRAGNGHRPGQAKRKRAAGHRRVEPT